MARLRSKIQFTCDVPGEGEAAVAQFEELRAGIETQFVENSVRLERLGYALEVSRDGGETFERATPPLP